MKRHISSAALVLGAILTAWAQAAPVLEGGCRYDESEATSKDPNPANAACNPMFKLGATATVDGRKWGQFKDEACQWYWSYRLAQKQKFDVYIKRGYPGGPKWQGGDTQTKISFLVVGPPFSPQRSAQFSSSQTAKTIDNQWTPLGPDPAADDPRLDPYVAAMLRSVEPPPFPKSMQDVYNRIVPDPSESRDKLHGVFFTLAVSVWPSESEVVRSAFVGVNVRCWNYVQDWLTSHRAAWQLKPISPGRDDGGEYNDLLPR